MAKQEVSIEQVISDLREKFSIGKEGSRSYENNGTFMIEKTEHERGDTIEMLLEYFDDKFIAGGRCTIEPITLLWTVFKIESINK